MTKPYNLFIGRFQSPHKGHQAIFDEYLSKNERILIAIRDVIPDENNPLNAFQVQRLWEEIYEDNGLVQIMIIPDIKSVNYGRGVGYEVKEIQANSDITAISATDIRNRIKAGDDSWKECVDEKIHDLLHRFIYKS